MSEARVSPMDVKALKQQAAAYAASLIPDHVVLGLGSGSTVRLFLEHLARRIRNGELRDVLGVPTSERTARHARDLGIPLTTLDDHPRLTLAVDGADEVDPQLNLIKGRGRALVREKIVAIHSDRLIIIVDETKLVPTLGRGPLPVEVLPFGLAAHVRWLESLGCRAEVLREPDGRPVVTDNGHHLVFCYFAEGIPDPERLAQTLKLRPGIVDHGLFLHLADQVIVGTREGIRVMEKA